MPVAPIWITNDGLEASSASLRFAELADILTAQASDAKAFAEDFFNEQRNATQNPPGKPAGSGKS